MKGRLELTTPNHAPFDPVQPTRRELRAQERAAGKGGGAEAQGAEAGVAGTGLTGRRIVLTAGAAALGGTALGLVNNMIGQRATTVTGAGPGGPDTFPLSGIGGTPEPGSTTGSSFGTPAAGSRGGTGGRPPAPGAAGRSTGNGRGLATGGAAGSGTRPTPGATAPTAPATAKPGQNSGANGTQGNGTGTGSGNGANGAPVAAPSTPGAGAPRQPDILAPSSDRDESYAQAMADQHQEIRGYDPQLPTGRTGPNISAPVADTPEAVRHLLRRAGYGIGWFAESEVTSMGIDAWLTQQLDPNFEDPSEGTIRSWFPHAMRDIAGVRASIGRFEWDAQVDFGKATLARQLFSKRQIFENVVDVMHSILHVTIPSDFAWDCGPDYGNRVIRAHAFGKFRDMLTESARHPAMIHYLNNVDSVDGEINENYGRELLELHTVSVNGGYTEEDVFASSIIMSGRRLNWDTGEFIYQPEHHVTGPVKVLDFQHENADANKGLELGDAYLAYLASHPSTARHVARRLATRFIADTPSESVVEHLAGVYLAKDTDILETVTEIFRLPEFWQTAGTKVRRPLEDVIGVVRSIGANVETSTKQGVSELYWELQQMGHAPMAWVPVNGFPDVASAWMSASQLIRRWNVHRSLTNGWTEGIEPSKEFLANVTPTTSMTVGAWVETVSKRTLGIEPTEQIKAAATAFLDASLDSNVTETHIGLTPHFTALFYNSPEFAIR